MKTDKQDIIRYNSIDLIKDFDRKVKVENKADFKTFKQLTSLNNIIFCKGDEEVQIVNFPEN